MVGVVSLRETHFLAVPLLAAPAQSLFIDDARSGAAAS
jgi:hypothetical protein